MASLSGPRPPTEVDLVQNPALGALLLWRFARTYQGEVAREVPLHLAFLVLPMVLHQGSRNEIVSTRKASGLTLFAAKLGEQRETKKLRSISCRATFFPPSPRRSQLKSGQVHLHNGKLPNRDRVHGWR